MRIERKSISVAQLIEGFVDQGETGVFSMNNRLTIRPPYQREFLYSEKQQADVIDTINMDCPIGVMYWAKNKKGESDFQFEILDGQQRALSICYYCNNKFTIDGRGWSNIDDQSKQKILDYKIDVYLIIDASIDERIKWFRRINIAGIKVNDQELRNAIYSGPFVTDARLKFSKTGCVAATQGAGYITGTPINQEILEKVLGWKAEADGKKSIEDYLAAHQWDENANDLWTYYQRIINWAKKNFDPIKGVTDKQNWGELYSKFHEKEYDKDTLRVRFAFYDKNYDVTKRTGIIPYILGGEKKEDTKYLSLRTFDEREKTRKYAEQEKKCPICKKEIPIEKMHAHHIKRWVDGGFTTYDNLMMICNECHIEIHKEE